MKIELPSDLQFLSELYVADAEQACLLAEYPSSNSDQTIFQNHDRYIIHDPFPPPPRELLTSLGPHHLMCAWGKHVAVTSQIAPPTELLNHWQNVFGVDGVPVWKRFDENDSFITLFPHESLNCDRQLVDPAVSYELHSKEVIEKIDCSQAEVLEQIEYPCIVKLSHGYAGLGNYLLRNDSDKARMDAELERHWPDAVLVVNSVIEDIVGDYGVQFYLRRDGSIVWLGLTEQHFNQNNRWCGGTYSSDLQTSLLEPFESIVLATAKHLHANNYFGVVGVDILRNQSGESFLVDVNPRLTGITPFLTASRIFESQHGLSEGIYQASFRFSGTLESLLAVAEAFDGEKVLVLSAFEDTSGDNPVTICHVSVSSKSQTRNREILDQLASS